MERLGSNRAPGAGVAWLVTILGAWLAGSVAAGWLGLWEPLPRPALQIAVVLLTGVGLGAVFGAKRLTRWAKSVPVRALVGLHLTRFVGFWFLWLESQGRLAREWAVPTAWGDIAVAVLAVVVLVVGTRGRGGLALIWVWNVLGLTDMVLVVANAGRLGLRDPGSIVELTRLPGCVIVTFLVPLILITHAIVFARLTAWRPEHSA